MKRVTITAGSVLSRISCGRPSTASSGPALAIAREPDAAEKAGLGARRDACYTDGSSHARRFSVSAVVPAPVDWVESVSRLRLPAKADRRLQELMDRNNEGRLTEPERAEMESLVEMSETIS